MLLLLTGGGNEKEAPKTPRSLADYASTDAVVRMSADGIINADQEHQAVRVTVGRDAAVYEQIQGYQGAVVDSQRFANSESAYRNLLYALARVGFTQGDASKALANETGRCPLGTRYVFELIENGKTIQRYWVTTCGGAKTFKGNQSATLELFRLQIPNYSEQVQDLANVTT